MTIDERLDRLTERHEALTQSHELFQHDLADLRRTVDKLALTVEGVTQIVVSLAASVSDVVAIVRSHEKRLDNLESAAGA